MSEGRMSGADVSDASISGERMNSADPTRFALRQAAEADLPAFVELVESAYRGDASRAGWTTEADLLGGQRLDLAMAQEMFAEPGSVILLAEAVDGGMPDGGPTAGGEPWEGGGPADRAAAAVHGTTSSALLGCVQIRQDGAEAYFGTFAIAPGRQGTGLGSALMRAAEEQARDRWGAADMRMTVINRRDDLIAYYERRGWQRTGLTSPFPYGDDRFGTPKVDDLCFVELKKPLG